MKLLKTLKVTTELKVIFFNTKNNYLNASIPIEVTKVLNSSKPLSQERLINEVQEIQKEV